MQTALEHFIKLFSKDFTVRNCGIVTIRHRIPRFDYAMFFFKEISTIFAR
jgi:hypothetical protein